MKVAVWDTYVTKENGDIMHFDIIVPETTTDEKTIFTFGKDYLRSKNQHSQGLSTKECQFCHIEQANDAIVAAIKEKGYYILEMQNCN